MDVYEAVRTVLAVRSYADRPVPREVVDRIVEAGRLTGSSMNGQPWHFVVVANRDTLRRMGELARSGPYIAQAAFAVAVAIEESPYSVSDGSRAIQSMILTAWAEGVASNWVGFLGPDTIKPLLGIPSEMHLLGIIPFGYPIQAAGQGKKKRKPLAQVVHSERFGQPYG